MSEAACVRHEEEEEAGPVVELRRRMITATFLDARADEPKRTVLTCPRCSAMHSGHIAHVAEILFPTPEQLARDAYLHEAIRQGAGEVQADGAIEVPAGYTCDHCGWTELWIWTTSATAVLTYASGGAPGPIQ